VIVIRNY